jgi:hypothetical protein
LFVIAACALVSFVVVLVLPHDPRLELAPEHRTQNAVGRR